MTTPQNPPWEQTPPQTPPPSSPPPTSTPTRPTALEAAVGKIAREAVADVLPEVEKAFEELVVREIAKKSKAVPEVPNVPDINLTEVIHKQQARSVALKSLLWGLGTAALTGAGTGLTAAAGYDWFTKEGLLATLVIVGTSVLHSVQSYFSQMRVTKGT